MSNKLGICFMAAALLFFPLAEIAFTPTADAAGRQGNGRAQCGNVSYLLPEGFEAVEVSPWQSWRDGRLYLFNPGDSASRKAAVFCIRPDKNGPDPFILTEKCPVFAGPDAKNGRNLQMTAEETIRKSGLKIKYSILEEQSGLRKQMRITGAHAYIPVLEAAAPGVEKHTLIIVNGGGAKSLDTEEYKSYVNSAAGKILKSIRPSS